MDPATEIEILLVEDNPHDAELTLRALKRQRLAGKMFLMEDGAQALEFVFATAAYIHRKVESVPKIVLLDLKLPKVEGLEVLRQIKSGERTRTIPVVVWTSSKEERDVVESYKLGVNRYIVKPMDFDKFAHAVSEIGSTSGC